MRSHCFFFHLQGSTFRTLDSLAQILSMYCCLSRKSELEKKLQENVALERLCMATTALVCLGVTVEAFPASASQGIE